MNLRPYQLECHEALLTAGMGAYIIAMATGTGKTVTMASYIDRYHHGSTVIWIAHRQELCAQAQREVPINVHVVSKQTLHNRLKKYRRPDVLVIDEAHHSAAKTYRTIIETLKPPYLYGLTATPNRGDNIRLDDLYDRIAFEYSLVQGIEDKALCPVHVRQVRTSVDLAQVRSRLGDFDITDLKRAINVDARNKLVAQLVDESPKPAMVFAVDVEHALDLAKIIPNSVAIYGDDSERTKKYEDFKNGVYNVLINCELYTEGADIPELRTVVMARPTKSACLYTQMAGRVTRLCDGKAEGLIVDIVDNTSKFPACQAPMLIGLDPIHPEISDRLVAGNLLADIPQQVHQEYNTFDAIVKSDILVKDWARQHKITTHNIAFTRSPKGELILSLPQAGKANLWWKIPPLQMIDKGEMQRKIDAVYQELTTNHSDKRMLWHIPSAKGWDKHAPSNSQKELIVRLGRSDWLKPTLTKYQASRLIMSLIGRKKCATH